MATGINVDGKTVSINDFVTIIGIISAVTGSDRNATVAVQPPLSTSTFTVTAQDLNTVEGTSCGPALGNSLTVGNQCTVHGLVTAISGSGVTALLTVTLSVSGASVSGVPAGACHSVQAV